MNEPAAWLRPKTTRRYIHPPKAERMYTLWAEGKLILGEIDPCIDWRSYRKLECSGLWLVHGARDEQLDFHRAQNGIPENGTPIHTLTHTLGDLNVDLETFCNIDRRPTCFIRLHLTNRGTASLKEPLALLLRSGKEKELVFASPDEYKSYAPDVTVWKNAPVTWRQIASAQTVLVDESVFLTAQGLPVIWDEKAGALRFTAALKAGESAELVLSFGKGEPLSFDYDQEKNLTNTFWERELSRIHKLPDSIQNNPELVRTIQNLTVHMLQCFCYSVGNAATMGKDILLPRQGGLQRLIWPWEATSMLESLGRIGDFSDYIESALSLYFDVLQAPDGEIRPAGEGWANITASALYSFARYCMDVRGRFYHQYRGAAMAAFDWMKRTRASSVSADGCFAGLFPPKRATDWGQEFQAWMSTDAVNVKGLLTFAAAAEQFGDPRAAEVRREADDYLNTLNKLMSGYEEAAEKTGRLRIPLCPDGNDEQLIKEFYPYFNFGRFPALGIVQDHYVDAVMNFLKADGIYCRGLYGHMPYPDGNMHIWYTTNPEYYWFLTWMRLGRREDASEILESMFRYSMTNEYYMVERYADNDPYYVPWSPNASGNGRMIIMLLDFYKDTTAS